MRGYGSWCIGWNEGSRKPIPPSNNNNGCLIIFIFFVVLLVISAIKVTFETGNPLGLFLALAVVAGLLKGLK